MEKITMEDIARIRTAGNMQISPDGKYAAYTVTEPDLKENGYRTDIWLLDRQDMTVKQLTFSGKNGQFIWDDADTLLLATVREAADTPDDIEEKTVFYRLPVCGGEARRAFSLKKNVTDFKKAADGLYAMTVLVDRNRPDPEKVDKDLCKEELDYHIFDEVPFWGNGRGYVSGKRSVLFLYEEKTEKLEQLTGDFTSVSGLLAEDGKLLFVSRTWQDLITMCAGVCLYDTVSKEMVTVQEEGKVKVEFAVFGFGGIVYACSDMKQWGNGQLCSLMLFDPASGSTSVLFENREELAIGDTPVSDTMRPSGIRVKGCGDHLTMIVMKTFHSDLWQLERGGDVSFLLGLDEGVVCCFDEDEKGICLIGSEKNGLNAVYVSDPSGCVMVHDINEGILAGKYIAEAEYIPFTDRDGVRIDGWVLRPMDFDPTKKYPGILEIHGGPRAAYGTALYHEMQIWASMGYFVFFCNPRGGEGYGEAFADLRGKYGTIDFNDLMDFTDHVLAVIPQIDPQRLGASGGSYGGFMCNWIEGNTDRFAAIASQRSISNWVADFGASEIGVTFDQNEMGATPWSDMQKMWDQSPLKYACNAKTPILFIHSLCDYNCPIDQGVEMFTAMKYHGVPSRMVVFEQENHGLSRTGKPKHRIRRLAEITKWFEQYLKA